MNVSPLNHKVKIERQINTCHLGVEICKTEIAMHKKCNFHSLHKQQQLLYERLDFVENILIFSIFIIRSSTRIVMPCWSQNSRPWLMCLIERKRIGSTVGSRIDLSFRKLKWNRYNSNRILLATCLFVFF